MDWSGLADVPTTYVNQFAATLGPPTLNGLPDGIYLLLGSIAPPIILGDTEASREASIRRAQAGVKVEVHGRFYLTRDRLAELINSLQTIANAYDKVEKENTQPPKWVASPSVTTPRTTE